ncbi:MAG: exonuclease domain-containing protein [Pseudomonadota bacterium]
MAARTRFLLILGLLFVLQLALLAAIVLSLAFAEDEATRELFAQMPGRHKLLLAGLALLLLGLLAAGLKLLFTAYLAPIARLNEDMVLLAANPRHRATAHGAPEMRSLAEKFNTMADVHQALHDEVTLKIELAGRALEEEKNRLAALMADLSLSVVVCNLEGHILLYNRRAKQLLEASHDLGLSAGISAIGLGRSVFSTLDRDLVVHALEQIRQELQQDDDNMGTPVAGFVVTIEEGREVQVQMAPVLDSMHVINGFVLTLEDVSGKAEGEGRGDERPQAFPLMHQERPHFYDFDLFHQPGQTAELDQSPLARISYTVFDTETTGLHPAAGDEIIAIGAVRIVNGRLLRQEIFEQLVKPRRPSSPESLAIHGITQAMLEGQPRIEKVLPQFHGFAEHTVLIAHNAAFDMCFLQMQQAATGVCFSQPVLDTLLLSQVIHPHQERHTLEAIAARLGVPVAGRHNALGDALVTAEVFIRMIPLLAEKGIVTLRDARDAEQRTPYARLRY